MRRTWELIRYSLENVARSPIRTLLTVAGISIASGALVSMVSLVIGLREQVEAPIQKLGLLNNIEVRPPSADQKANGSDHRSPASAPVLDEAMVDRLEQLEGVDYAYPDLRLSQVRLIQDDRQCESYAIGLPREASLLGYFDELLIAGDFFSLDKRPQVIIGEKLVQQLNLESAPAAIGQMLQLQAAGLVRQGDDQFGFHDATTSVTIAGVYRPPSFATNLGGDAVLLPVDLMRDLPGTLFERNLHRMRSQSNAADEYTMVIVRVERPQDVYRVQDTIRKMGLRAESLLDKLQDMRKFFVFLEVLLASVGTVALLVGGLGILNTLLMAVIERTQEIGIYKTLGASTGDIRIMFLTEAAMVGLIGGLGGLALARIVCWFLQWAANTYAQQQGVEGPLAVFRFPTWLLVAVVAYAVAVSLLSGWYPASRAAKIDPIRALRSE